MKTIVTVCLLFSVAVLAEPEYVVPVPLAYGGAYAPAYKNYEPHNYHFDYAVSDPHTGDHKSQWEVKENGVVKGGYSLLEPDGTTRVVEYIADHDGFRAVVKKIGTAIHPIKVETPQVVVEEPKPIYLDYKGAYNGYYGNYGPQVQYEAPKVVYEAPVVSHEAPIVSHEAPVAPIALSAPEVVYPQQQIAYPQQEVYGGQQPEVKVEYHGFTGNGDDDSAYTNYGHLPVVSGGYEGGGYDGGYDESRQQLLAVPYKSLQGYHEQPLPYQLIVKY